MTSALLSFILCVLPLAAGTTGKPTSGKIKLLGTVSLTAPGTPNLSGAGLEIRKGPNQNREFRKQISGTVGPARVPASHVPTPLGSLVAPGAPLLAFDGITHADQRFAGTGPYDNTQYSLEPPDQALAVGNGFVLEAVNTALRVRAADTGAPLTVVVALNQFFDLAPEIIRSTPPVYGPFTADPKVYWDPATGRFFVTLLKLGVVPA
ncbi:MAG: hypothetical protein HY820_14345, partial [Acidobacteria bacterium]|nr:hypothetical protein [Acidobacteriota bacterium]